MALKATIFKAELQVSDVDRNYYHDHALTLARHPSETDERMMVRLLAFALHADAALAFGKGLSEDDEPGLWQKDLTGAIDLWIDVGLPDEKRIRKACGRAAQVVVYSYGGRGADLWWTQNGGELERIRNLTVANVPLATSAALARLARRNMQLQCTIQEGAGVAGRQGGNGACATGDAKSLSVNNMALRRGRFEMQPAKQDARLCHSQQAAGERKTVVIWPQRICRQNNRLALTAAARVATWRHVAAVALSTTFILSTIIMRLRYWPKACMGEGAVSISFSVIILGDIT